MIDSDKTADGSATHWAISAAAVFAAGLTGARAGPQHVREAAWYALLRKPRLTPPGPAVGAIWTGLEVLLCIAGKRLMQAPPSSSRNRALGSWWTTLAGLALFPHVFFGNKQLGASNVVSAGMLATAAACAVDAERVDRKAAASMLPVVVWLSLATALTAGFWKRN